jgi:hypothetical protein
MQQKAEPSRRRPEIRAAIPSDGKEASRIVFDILRSYGIEPDPEHLDRDVVAFGSGDRARGREFAAILNGALVGVCTDPDATSDYRALC